VVTGLEDVIAGWDVIIDVDVVTGAVEVVSGVVVVLRTEVASGVVVVLGTEVVCGVVVVLGTEVVCGVVVVLETEVVSGAVVFAGAVVPGAVVFAGAVVPGVVVVAGAVVSGFGVVVVSFGGSTTLIVSGVTLKSSASLLFAPLHLERDFCSLPEAALSALTNGSVRMVKVYSPTGVSAGITRSEITNALSYAQLTLLAHAVVFFSDAATPFVLPSEE
jgi:hypothetical protein